MRFEQLDLNLLVALDILLEEQNITMSADKLHLSQSATSSILSRLRQYFDDDLLVQVGRKMQPTPYALELHGPVREMLNIVRGSITNKRRQDPKDSHRLFRIVASDYIIQVFLAPLLAKLADEAPHMMFEFISPFTVDVDILAKSGADLIITPQEVRLENYPSESLVIDELVCIADKNHGEITNGLTTELMTTLGHVSVGFGRISHLSIEPWLKEKQLIERKIEVITNDFSTLCFAIVGSKRLGVVPKRFAHLKAKYLPLRIEELPFSAPILVENMLWHPTLDSDPVHKWLREKILSQCRSVQSELHP